MCGVCVYKMWCVCICVCTGVYQHACVALDDIKDKNVTLKKHELQKKQVENKEREWEEGRRGRNENREEGGAKL